MCLYVFIYVFIGFRQRNLGSRQALARLSLAKKHGFNMFCIGLKEGIVKGMYIVFIVFQKFVVPRLPVKIHKHISEQIGVPPPLLLIGTPPTEGIYKGIQNILFGFVIEHKKLVIDDC